MSMAMAEIKLLVDIWDETDYRSRILLMLREKLEQIGSVASEAVFFVSPAQDGLRIVRAYSDPGNANLIADVEQHLFPMVWEQLLDTPMENA